MKFRMHREYLTDSMKTATEVDGRAGLLTHIRNEFADIGPSFQDNQLWIKPYGGDDKRIGWKDVHIVIIEGYGPVGFCEGPDF